MSKEILLRMVEEDEDNRFDNAYMESLCGVMYQIESKMELIKQMVNIELGMHVSSDWIPGDEEGFNEYMNLTGELVWEIFYFHTKIEPTH